MAITARPSQELTFKHCQAFSSISFMISFPTRMKAWKGEDEVRFLESRFRQPFDIEAEKLAREFLSTRLSFDLYINFAIGLQAWRLFKGFLI